MTDPVALTVPQSSEKVRKADRESFRLHAAPESIVWHLEKARARRSAAENEVDWLQTLLTRRLQQISKGEWPPAPSPDREDGR